MNIITAVWCGAVGVASVRYEQIAPGHVGGTRYFEQRVKKAPREKKRRLEKKFRIRESSSY